MTYKELEDKVIGSIKALYGEREARSMQRFLFYCFSGIEPSGYLLIRHKQAGEEFENKVLVAISQLMNYTPVQYITGKTWFCGKEFIIRPGVLIPRPETEEMVLKIAEKYKFCEEISILDIGTGSGAIAISIELLLNSAKVTALDISKEALAVARENAVLNRTDTKFIESDILNKEKLGNLGMFDLIISNPPYIRKSERMKMNRNVLDHEPAIALFVEDSDPLQFYRSILAFSKDHLEAEGEIWFEINESEEMGITNLMKEYGFNKLQVFKDIHSKPRFVAGSKNGNA